MISGDTRAMQAVDYQAIRAMRVTCVASSYALFFARGGWMIRDSAMLGRVWLRFLPHVNDTLLLAGAIALARIASRIAAQRFSSYIPGVAIHRNRFILV